MQRRVLAITTIALVLLFTATFHLAVTQVALAQEGATSAPGAASDAQPLPQPMRITFRQSIPLTITVAAAAPLTSSEELAAQAAGALMGTLLNNIGAGDAVTATEAAEDPPVDATGELTGTAGADADAGALDAQALLTPTTVATATDFAVVLTIEFDVVVTDTLTTTVPALVTVQVSENVSATMTLSATLAPQPDGEMVLALIPTATPEAATPEVVTPEVVTPTLVATAAATATVTVTPTVESTSVTVGPIPATIGDLAVVATTTVVTANVRSGPGTNFDQVTQFGPDTPVGLVAISEDGQWYLLSSGAWIAGFLVADQPTDLPIATQAIIDQVTAAAAAAPVATAAATPAASEAATPEAATPEATPTPVAAPATPATVTTNANVRGGPGTEFPIVGGTVTGQTINIIGRNADGAWYLLDFGAGATGWVSAELVANAPAADAVPVFNADGTPVVAPTATPAATPATGGGLALPTPTPAAAAAAANTIVAAADPATTTYLASVADLINAYDGALVALDTLIAEARANNTRLTDAAWIARLDTAVTQLRTTNATVGELQPPATLADVQDNLIAAARQYNLAANALEEASSTGAAALIDTADEAIQAANASLTAAEVAIRQAGQ